MCDILKLLSHSLLKVYISSISILCNAESSGAVTKNTLHSEARDLFCPSAQLMKGKIFAYIMEVSVEENGVQLNNFDVAILQNFFPAKTMLVIFFLKLSKSSII